MYMNWLHIYIHQELLIIFDATCISVNPRCLDNNGKILKIHRYFQCEKEYKRNSKDRIGVSENLQYLYFSAMQESQLTTLLL